MLFDWHDDKSDVCFAERGFDFAYVRRVFEGNVIEFTDDRRDYGERRTIAFGAIEGTLYAVIYTQRDDVRWIISAFRCRQKELDRWKRRVAGGQSDPGGSTVSGSGRPRKPTTGGT